MGLLTGSYNFTRSSQFKDNDIVLYSILLTSEDYDFFGIHEIEDEHEKILSLNIARAVYDFSISWINSSGTLECLDCGGIDFNPVVICKIIGMHAGINHFIENGAIGAFAPCDNCGCFCNESPKIVFKGPTKILDVLGCTNCDAVISSEGGLIGYEMVLPFHYSLIEERANDEENKVLSLTITPIKDF